MHAAGWVVSVSQFSATHFVSEDPHLVPRRFAQQLRADAHVSRGCVDFAGYYQKDFKSY